MGIQTSGSQEKNSGMTATCLYRDFLENRNCTRAGADFERVCVCMRWCTRSQEFLSYLQAIEAIWLSQLSLRAFPLVLDPVDAADTALDLTEAIFVHLLNLFGGVY
jgi:hypothetical protein